jgi:hypothetical protein
MTNATKTLAVLFAGTLVLAVASTWGGSAPSSAAFQGQLLTVDPSAVQALRIDRPQAPPVRLTRSADGWTVSPPDTAATYPVRPQSADQLLDRLAGLQVRAVPTRQPENHPRYGVDSTGARIALLGDGGEPLGRLVVGRTRMRQPQSRGGQTPTQRMQQRRGSPITYVRVPDRPDVYSVEQSLRSVAQRSIDDWRDARLWAVDRSTIQQIDFSFPGDSSFTMRRAAPADTASAVGPSTWVSEGDTLSSTAVSPLLRTLAAPEADGFVEAAPADGLDPGRYNIQVHLRDGSRRTLHLRPSPDGTYRATSEEVDFVARLQGGRWDDLLRGREALLPAD